MELFFLALLILMLAGALASGFPVAFAIPGSAILTIALAAACGYLLAGDINAFFVHGGGPDAWLSAGVLNFRSVYRSDENDTLIAIPLFVFMGLMLQRSKVAEDLLLAMARLFSVIRGGLGLSVILVGALLAATTGIVGATVVTLGMISLPTMLQANYSKSFASGIVAATGTLGQIIPPSIVLLILVHQLTTAVDQASTARRTLFRDLSGQFNMPSEFDVFSVSAGEMFMGALVPGMVLVGLYIAYVIGCAVLQPQLAPTAPSDKKFDVKAAANVLLALAPPLALIFLVLGSIIAGVATVNQAGAIGAAGATLMAGYRLCEGKRNAFAPTLLAIVAVVAIGMITQNFNVNLRKIYTNDDVLGVVLAAIATVLLAVALFWSGWRTLIIGQTMRTVVQETTKITSLVFIILLGAVMLTAAFRAFGGEELVRTFLQQLPGGFWGQFTIVMLIIFALGFFLDFIEITVVVVPIVAPILLADPSANITAVWLGVMIGLVVQTSFLTPPFGFTLFYLRGIAPPGISTVHIYKGVAPFIGIQLLALGIVGAYPGLVNYVPTRVLLLSEHRPPTTNPRLQYCVEKYVSGRFAQDIEAIRRSINEARSLDLSMLPAPFQSELLIGINKAESAFSKMDAVSSSERAVSEAAVRYRPVHTTVRGLEREARRIDKEITKLDVVISRVGGIVTEEAGQRAKDRRLKLIAQRDARFAQVPAGWGSVHKEFSLIQRNEFDARRSYRRTVDEAYRSIANILAAIRDAKELKAIVPDIAALKSMVNSKSPVLVRERIVSIRSALRGIVGVSDVRKSLNSARRALRSKSPNPEAARKSIATAIALVEAEVAWRQRASVELFRKQEAYEAAIADTIGLRGQSQLPDHVAAVVAGCSATPRDISLNF